jgi:hypothetical protein
MFFYSAFLPPQSHHVLQAGSSDVAAQQAAQVCLGLLGAVDPTRVSMPPPPASCLLPSDLALLVHLIERHLVRVLRVSAHLHQLDAAVYSIQVRQSPVVCCCPGLCDRIPYSQMLHLVLHLHCTPGGAGASAPLQQHWNTDASWCAAVAFPWWPCAWDQPCRRQHTICGTVRRHPGKCSHGMFTVHCCKSTVFTTVH